MARKKEKASVSSKPEKQIILIIEDDEVLLRALYLKFQRLGYTLSSATDGECGLKVAQRVLPDVILLDLIIPKMNGFDVLHALKSDKKTAGIPVIVLSNLGDKSDIERAKKLGAKDYYVKADTDLEELEKQIIKIIK